MCRCKYPQTAQWYCGWSAAMGTVSLNPRFWRAAFRVSALKMKIQGYSYIKWGGGGGIPCGQKECHWGLKSIRKDTLFIQ